MIYSSMSILYRKIEYSDTLLAHLIQIRQNDCTAMRSLSLELKSRKEEESL